MDPLDGTKEFLKRNGQFTVNIALLRGGTPVLGVVQIPAQVGSLPGSSHVQRLCSCACHTRRWEQAQGHLEMGHLTLFFSAYGRKRSFGIGQWRSAQHRGRKDVSLAHQRFPGTSPHGALVPPWSAPLSQDKVYWAVEGQGAHVRDGSGTRRLRCAEFDMRQPGLMVVASASHLTPETQAFVEQLNEPVFTQLGSSLKLLMVGVFFLGGGGDGSEGGFCRRSCCR